MAEPARQHPGEKAYQKIADLVRDGGGFEKCQVITNYSQSSMSFTPLTLNEYLQGALNPNGKTPMTSPGLKFYRLTYLDDETGYIGVGDKVLINKLPEEPGLSEYRVAANHLAIVDRIEAGGMHLRPYGEPRQTAGGSSRWIELSKLKAGDLQLGYAIPQEQMDPGQRINRKFSTTIMVIDGDDIEDIGLSQRHFLRSIVGNTEDMLHIVRPTDHRFRGEATVDTLSIDVNEHNFDGVALGRAMAEMRDRGNISFRRPLLEPQLNHSLSRGPSSFSL